METQPNQPNESAEQDMREEVRKLTVEAVTHGRIDTERLKLIIGFLSEATGASVRTGSKEIKDTLKPALSTLEQTLSKSAETSKLAVEEALSHISEFSKRDLPKVADDFEALSKLFFDAATRAASGANALAKTVLNDLAEHAKHASTGAEQPNDAITPTKDSFAHVGAESVRVTSQISQNVVRHLAQLASGILAGLADSLATRASSPSNEHQHKAPDAKTPD